MALPRVGRKPTRLSASADAPRVIIDADFVILRPVPARPVRRIAALGVAALRAGPMHVAAVGRHARPKTDVGRETPVLADMRRT